VSNEPSTLVNYQTRLQNSQHLSFLLPCGIENNGNSIVCAWINRAEFNIIKDLGLIFPSKDQFPSELDLNPDDCSEYTKKLNLLSPNEFKISQEIKGIKIYDDGGDIMFCTKNNFAVLIKADDIKSNQALEGYFNEFYTLN